MHKNLLKTYFECFVCFFLRHNRICMKQESATHCGWTSVFRSTPLPSSERTAEISLFLTMMPFFWANFDVKINHFISRSFIFFRFHDYESLM